MSVRRALAWSFAERYASLLVTTTSMVVLARLLTPREVGVYSLCAALLAVIGIVRDFGVSEYLIQERDLTRAKIRSASGVALAAAWGIGTTVLLISETVAQFFGEPGVDAVLSVTVLQILLLPLSSPAFALLNRELEFRKIFVLQLSCNAAQAVVTIALALRGMGFLALAWGPVTNVAVQTVLLCWWRPKDVFLVPAVSLAIRPMLRFGAMYVGSRALETTARQSHEPFIAKLADFASVGLFSRAFGMVEMFQHNLTDAVVRVTTPAFASAHREGRPLAPAFARATAMLVSVSWPIFGFVALCSREAILVLFGAQWLPAAPLASILALSALPLAPYELIPQLLSGTGRVKRRLRMSAWTSMIHIGLVAGAALFGLTALAWTFVVSGALTAAFGLVQVQRALGASLRSLLEGCPASLTVSAVSVGMQWVTLFGCRSLDLGAPTTLASVTVAGTIGWAATARALRHPAYAEACRLVAGMRSQFQNAA